MVRTKTEMAMMMKMIIATIIVFSVIGIIAFRSSITLIDHY